MSRKIVEIPVEVWEFSLQDAEHIAALHRETLRLMNENARLKAEVERLRASSFVTAVPVEEYEKLKAEVERLRKAGDAMAQEIIGCYRGEGYDPADSETLPKWLAAKEGKPSV